VKLLVWILNMIFEVLHIGAVKDRQPFAVRN